MCGCNVEALRVASRTIAEERRRGHWLISNSTSRQTTTWGSFEMPKPVGASIIALTIALLGAATVLVGGFASMVALTTPDAHLGLKIALPASTTWLAGSLIRLVMALGRKAKDDDWIDPLLALRSAPKLTPDAAMRTAWPQASFYQEVLLPPDASARRLLRHQKVALKITMRDERSRYLVRWRRRSSVT